MTIPESEYIEEITTRKGDLEDISEYVCYRKGSDEVCLDGQFKPDQLRAIADYIDKHK